MLGVSGDVERGAERLHIAAEEVRGADYAPLLALVPVGDNHFGVGSIGDLGADSRGEPREHLGVRHVQAEQQFLIAFRDTVASGRAALPLTVEAANTVYRPRGRPIFRMPP